MKFNGIIVSLAYPETMVSQEQFWYRPIFELVGLGKGGKIRAGHAAILLINKRSGHVDYADFGRYITKDGYGRARTKKTDPELDFGMKAEFDEFGEIKNLTGLLEHLYQYPERTHGDGPLFASYMQVDYQRAVRYVKELQSAQYGQAYGPFSKDSTNCSRFVRDIILYSRFQGKLSIWNRVKRVSPSPLGNVIDYAESPIWKINGQTEMISPTSRSSIVFDLFKKNEISSEERTKSKYNPPSGAQWLNGTGAGCWFTLVKMRDNYLIKRYDKTGQTIFNLPFKPITKFSQNEDYKILHGTNAQVAFIKQGNKVIQFYRSDDSFNAEKQ